MNLHDVDCGASDRPSFKSVYAVEKEPHLGYLVRMTMVAEKFVEEFKRLAPDEQREVCAAVLQVLAVRQTPAAPRARGIATIAGKYRPLPNPEAPAHDLGFVEAIIASKRSTSTP